MRTALALALALCAVGASALYEPKGAVLQASASSFSKVTSSKVPIVVVSPWRAQRPCSRLGGSPLQPPAVLLDAAALRAHDAQSRRHPDIRAPRVWAAARPPPPPADPAAPHPAPATLAALRSFSRPGAAIASRWCPPTRPPRRSCRCGGQGRGAAVPCGRR